MRSERICSLARYLMADAMNAPMTASVQWLERTLDDSANRRISMPEGFLCADAILRLAQNVTDGLHVNEKVVDATVREYLPFIATENLMMEAVKRGGNRQELHEIIRTNSMAATAQMKEGNKCDLLARLAAEPAFGMTEEEMEAVLTPSAYIGRCPEQVAAFLAQVRPLLPDASADKPEINLLSSDYPAPQAAKSRLRGSFAPWKIPVFSDTFEKFLHPPAPVFVNFDIDSAPGPVVNSNHQN